MNNSPFEIFRRNLKPLMVLLTGLALFAFVVLPVVDSYMRQNAGSGGDAVVARYDGKSLTRNRVDYFTRNHHDTVQFLAKLAEATIQRGGVPRTAGFQYDPQSKRVLSLGINQAPGAQVSIRTMMFAEQAMKSGFELDDNAIQSWLDRFTDGMVSDNDITSMLMSETQNRMGRPHLYEQLRNHLLADVYLKRGYAGLYSGDNPSAGALMTPSEQWEAFVKLNRSATVDAYGVLVNDYLDQTDPNPPEDVVLATYEEGKLRDADDQSPDPAFHRRYTASFEYLVGDLNKFIDEEVAKLKEEDIRAEYERRLAGGEFQLPDTDLEKVLEGADSKEDSESKGEDTIETDNSEEAADSSDKSPEQDSDSASDGETKETSNDSPAEPADPEREDGAKDSADAPAPEAEETAEENGTGDEQSALLTGGPVKLVALQDEDEQAAGDAQEGESQKSASAGDDADGDKSEPEDSGSDEPSEEATNDKDEGQDDTSDSESDEGDQEDKKDEGEAESKADGESKEGETKADDEAKEEDKPKVETFEDVRERLAEQMAFPAARQRIDEAAKKIYKQMQSYFTENAIHDSNVAVGQVSDPPQRPDLEALAKEVGFEFKSIGPYDRVTIADEPISTSMDAASQFGGRGPNFALMMYGYVLGENEVEPREKFSPIQTTEFMSGKTYVSWKTDDRKADTPMLDEVRDEVVQYVRMKEARRLAKSAADELAKKFAEQGDKPLTELIPEDKQDNLNEGLGPFKWLDSFGRGVTMGNVPELDSVGDDFMSAVFDSEVGQYRVAANQPERVFYIVKPTKFEPDLDELRQRFRQPNNRRNLTAIDAGIGSILGEFFESVDEKAGFADLTVTEQ